jgi:hypothetical protein
MDSMMPRYPKPDRSDQKPNFMKSEENDAIDIGWQEGILSDGRPYRAEAWCQDQVTFLTIFLSAIDLENARDADFLVLLENERLVHFKDATGYPYARKVKDASGNEVWAITMVVGFDEQTFLEDNIPLRPYSR